MIRLFDRNEINYNHNKTILTPLSCYVIEEANGMFELEAEFPKTTIINDGDIIKAPTPRGEQLFRIYRSKKTLKGKTAYARHIFYDLSKNFLIDVKLDNVSGFTAIQELLNNAEAEHNFIGTSDVLTTGAASYMRINPVQAIIGEENSILNIWGGNLVRDNFKINIKTNGIDRGYEIRLGKNLIGIEDDSDESSVKTRIYPTVSLEDTVYTLPEKYVDSPLINNYGDPIIYTEEIKLTDEQKVLPVNDIYNVMRDYCNSLFEVENIDKPVVNYKIDFVELSKTEQYKDLAILEQLDLYDIVSCKVSHLDINVKARVIKYKYDCVKDRYESIELGDFSSVSSYKTENIVKQIREQFKANESAIEYATNVITGNKGGYLVTRRYPNGKPYELLIMDTEDINTAQNVFRLNNSGLGFSRNGYNGSFNTAMTIDGHIVADYMDTGTLTSVLLKSDNYIFNASGTKINLSDGTIDSKNFKLDSSGNITSTGGILQSANYVSNFSGTKFNMSDGTIDSKNFKVNASGNLTANNATLNNGTFSGIIQGAIINGGEFNSYDISLGTLNIEGAYIMGWDTNGNNDLNIDCNGNVDCKTLTTNVMNCSSGYMNNSLLLSAGNKDNYQFYPMYHTHSGYASLLHNQSSYTIFPELTQAGNISLYGSPNAASTTWCLDTFASKSASDFRLKKNIQSLDLSDELFMALKPKSFEFKCDEYNKGQVFGLLSQQVESAFKQYGYDPYSYNLIELVDPKTAYTDEGLYIGKDKVHRINYNNLIPWNISMTQKLFKEVATLKEVVYKQQDIIDRQANKLDELEQRLCKLEVA